ncbi:MAG: hypothetical protein JXA15_10745 [Spirochaetales bacterium]|nr:hypothetical protein [Spirochaetales bacterium]
MSGGRMGKKGLLQKAKAVHMMTAATGLANPPGNLDSGMLEAARAAGLSGEDGEDILKRIDAIAVENRIATPETGKIPALRRGILVPALVNALAIVGMAVGFLLLAAFFRAREADIASNSAVVLSAEGRLIRELRAESESLIREKDVQLDEIRDRLESLEKDSQELAMSFEARLLEREVELKARLESEIEAERARLRSEGYAEAEIEARIREFEIRKTAEFQSALASFRVALDSERAASDARIAAARAEYERNLAEVASERRRIQDEASARETELRSSLDARVKALETERAQASAGLEAARAELLALQERQAADKAAEDRIVGLYRTIRLALSDRRYEDAYAGVSALSAFLADPAIASSTTLAARREADVFIAQSLATLVKVEIDRASADAAGLVTQAELYAQARAAGARGDEALARGDRAAAEAAYRDAVAVAPELVSAFEFAWNARSIDAAVNVTGAALAFERAELAYAAGDFAAASASYLEALSAMGAPASAGAVAASALSVPTRAAAGSPSPASASELAAANRLLERGAWAEATESYIRILSDSPGADIAGQAARGARRALEGWTAAEKARVEADRARIAELSARATRLETELAGATLATSERDAALAESKRLIAALEEERDRLRSENEELASRPEAASSAPAQVASGPSTEEFDALKAERDALAALAKRMDELAASFSVYAAREDSARAGSPGQAGLLAARTELDAFLGSAVVRSAMPDLRERVAAYEAAWLEAGQKEVVYNAIDILEGSRRFTESARRNAWLDEQLARYAGNQALKDFIETVRALR